MKKLLSAIIMTALVGLGLVAVSSPPANAACPYTACINTTTSSRRPPRSGLASRWRSRSMSLLLATSFPKGTVTVGITKNGKGVYQSTQAYAGGRLTFVTQSLRRGNYAVTATFTANPSSVFNSSNATTSFVIKKKRRR